MWRFVTGELRNRENWVTSTGNSPIADWVWRHSGQWRAKEADPAGIREDAKRVSPMAKREQLGCALEVDGEGLETQS